MSSSNSQMSYIYFLRVLVCEILIVGGVVDNGITNSSYTMGISFDDIAVHAVDYRTLPNYPFALQCASVGNFKNRSLVIGGVTNNGDSSSECYEFDRDTYHIIPSMNVTRYYAASTFTRNKLIVTGGWNDDEYDLDSIEILDWSESNQGHQWVQSSSKLPFYVSRHTLVTCNNKLYLIGGYNNWESIWEGRLDCIRNEITWTLMEIKLQKKRIMHFSFVISNKIIVFGGGPFHGSVYDDNDVVEIIEGTDIKEGPNLKFRLSSDSDQAVLDTKRKRILITSKNHGLITYDYERGIFEQYPEIKLREKRTFYGAILQ